MTTGWLCLEQPGPWGSDTLRNSVVNAKVGQELVHRGAAAGMRTVLIRRPGKRRHSAERTVYLASIEFGKSVLRRVAVFDLRELLDWDLSSVEVGEVSEDPLLLICTNGRRDVCCALTGRPLVAELASRHGNAVWESTHLGGHRFAPTALLLPTGYSYGRMDATACEHVLAEAAEGRVVIGRCRGRSMWGAPGQVAELALRKHLAEFNEDSVEVVEEIPCGSDFWDVRLRHRQTALWRVVVNQHPSPPIRPLSCDSAPEIAVTISVAMIEPVL